MQQAQIRIIAYVGFLPGAHLHPLAVKAIAAATTGLNQSSMHQLRCHM